jgi:hypothetical protein
MPPITPADQVARGVDPHFEPNGLHQLPDVPATGDIRVAECDTTHPTLGVCAKSCERSQMLLYSRRIRGGHLHVRRGQRKPRRYQKHTAEPG